MRFCAIILSGTGRTSYDVNVYVILNTPTFWADTWTDSPTDSPSMCPSTVSDGQSVRVNTTLVIATRLCVCRVTVDSAAKHGPICRKSAGRLPHHGAVKGLVKRALLSATFRGG